MDYKIGYLDENPEQVKIYQRKLKPHNFEVVGYNVERGMSEDEIINQIYESEIDLLMIDYFLKDRGVLAFNGDVIERLYSELKPKFPVIIFTSHENDAYRDVDNPNIIYEKEMVLDENKIGRFIEILIKNIKAYQKFQAERKKTIEELMVKGEQDGLDANEKNQLLQAQLDLENLDKKTKKEVPLQLISNDKLDEISKVKKEAEEFLQELIKKKRDRE